MKEMMQVMTGCGKKLSVDISDEACEKFKGLKHKHRIKNKKRSWKGTVAGVAPACGCSKSKNSLALWCFIDGNKGVSCILNIGDISSLETKEVTTAMSGKTLIVNISKEVCMKFGFEHGDNIIHTDIGIVKHFVEGVALSTCCSPFETLWLSSKETEGKAIFIHPWNPDNFSLVV